MCAAIHKSYFSIIAACLCFSRASSWTLAGRHARATQMNPTIHSSNSRLKMNQNNPSERQVDNLVGDTNHEKNDDDDGNDLIPLVECIVKAADGRKAENIVALRVRPVSTLTSYLVILSGNSRPQNQAISKAIVDAVEEEFEMRTQGNGVPEGTADSGWMLLDYGSVMVHIMTPRSRLFYDIERQWRERGGEEVDLSHVLIPNSMVEAAGESSTVGGLAEDDPFWS